MLNCRHEKSPVSRTDRGRGRRPDWRPIRSARGPDRCAHVPVSGRLGDPDRLRVRRRHLAGAPRRRSGDAAEFASRRGDVPALLARRHPARLHRPTTTATSTCTSSRRRAARRRASPIIRWATWCWAGIRTAGASCSPRAARAAGSGTTSSTWSAVDGGLPEKLPIPYGEFGAFSPDGRQFAYMPMSQDFRTWKRYRGGWSPDLWLFDLQTFASRNLTSNPANDAQPMWVNDTIYFLSDRGRVPRNNIWAYDVSNGRDPPGHVADGLRHHLPFAGRRRTSSTRRAGGCTCSTSRQSRRPKCRSRS